MLRHCVQVATPPRYPHVGEKHRRVERVIKHMDYTCCFDEDPAALMQFSTRLYLNGGRDQAALHGGDIF
jgi:hypothetical protein